MRIRHSLLLVWGLQLGAARVLPPSESFRRRSNSTQPPRLRASPTGLPRDDDGGGGGSSGRPTSSSSSNSSSGSGNGRPGYSASSVFDLSDGDVPSAFTAVGPISVKANMQLLRLADYGSAQQTHLYGDLRSLVRLDDDAADPDKVSMSFKIKIGCSNSHRFCKGNVAFMLYSPDDGGRAGADTDQLTRTGLTARLWLPNERDQVVLNGHYVAEEEEASDEVTGDNWYPMSISWDKRKGLAYKSGAVDCRRECANKPNLADALDLPPTLDWKFRLSVYPTSGYEMQVDVKDVKVSASRRRALSATPRPTPAPTPPPTPAPTDAPTRAPTAAPTRGTIKALGLRVRVLATKGNTNDVQWADWQFMAGDGSFPEVLTAKATGTWPENHGVSPGMGTDGDMATKYYNEEASISAWWVTFSTPQLIAGYAWATADDYASRDPVAWAIDYTVDGNIWYTSYDMRAYQDITDRRNVWAGTWWFRSSCYVNGPPPAVPTVTALCMRVRVLETRRASDLQFSEFWFLRPYGEHVQPKLITATGSWPVTDTLDPRNAEDNDLTTKYYNLHALTSALTVRFEYPQTVSGYTWATADDYPERDPIRWTIDSSEDCIIWDTDISTTPRRQAVTQQRGAWAGTWWFRPNCNRPMGCGTCGKTPVPPVTQVQALCMRVRVMQNRGSVADIHWSEWWFTGPDGKTHSPEQVTAAGDWPEGSGPSMAADNDLTTSYYDNYVLGSSWTVRFPAARWVSGYTWATASDWSAKDPVGWAIDYSTDCSEWVMAYDVRMGQAITAAREMWAGTWSFATSCYIDPTAPGCCGCL